MSKKVYLIVLLAVLCTCIGIYAGHSFLKTRPNVNKSTSKTITPKMGIETVTSKSIAELLDYKNNIECSYLSNIDGVVNSGKIYISNGKLKGDFLETKGSKNIKSYILNKDGYFYSWESESLQGVKIKTEQLTLDKGQQLESLKNINNKYELKCKPQETNANLFKVPNNINFTDFSQVINTANGNLNICAGCEFITEQDSKNECKKQFNCK